MTLSAIYSPSRRTRRPRPGKHTRRAVPVVIVSGFPDVPRTLLTIVDGFVQKGNEPELIIGAIAIALARNR